jgi:hypothetical protein
MALTNAEQARCRERHLKSEDGTKLRAQFIFDASTNRLASALWLGYRITVSATLEPCL